MTVPVRFDHDRAARVGLPEAVLCEGKTDEQLRAVVSALRERPPAPALFTRMAGDQRVVVEHAAGCELDFDTDSGTAFLHGRQPARSGCVAVVTAGTSDLGVAREAVRTLEFLGINGTCIADVGVAGLWRLEARLDAIRTADVVIVVAGMDGALASVVGGLVSAPVIGVPTSTGYGVARDGETALHTMLCSCAQGVLVANIDNGFGAACAAARILAIAP
jgi:pyridinium-3,5-biscarboxylic acid mononucleotide synthase